MNKYLCHVQDIVLLRIVVLQRLGILRNYGLSAYCFRFKLASFLSSSHRSHELWVNTLMGHMGLGQTILTHYQH